MTEPSPPPPPAVETVQYRPLSGLAIAGLILAALFSGWLVLAALVALRTRTPLLIQPAWLLVPSVAALLSALGWLQIHRSEGSRVGTRLAQWGLLLGVLSVFGYGAWYAMTELPLRLQARDFTDAWFDDLRQSQTDDRLGSVAFWCTVHPLRRDNSSGDLGIPDDRDALLKATKRFQGFQEALRHRHLWGDRGQKGELPLFFDHEVVRIVRQAGPEAEVESLGVRDWEYVGGSEPGYKVEQAYRVRTPDGTFEITVPVLSRNSDRRRWQVLLPETVVSRREHTPRGELLDQLRIDSYRFAADWVKKLGEGHREEVAVDTKSAMGNPKRVEELKKEIKAFFRPGGDGQVTLQLVPLGPNSTSPYEMRTAVVPEELVFYHPFEARIGSKYRCEGLIAVATADKKLLAGLESADAAVLPEGTSAQRNARWRIRGLRLLLGGEIVPARK